MKNLFWAFGILLGLSACGGSEGFTLTGSLQDSTMNGKTAYLVNYDTGDKLDSVKVVGDTIVMAHMIDSVMPVAITLNGRRIAEFIMESGELVADFEKGTVTGSPLNDRLAFLSNSVDSIYADYKDKAGVLYDSGIGMEEAQKESAALEERMGNEVTSLLRTAFAENKDNPVGYFAFLQLAYDMDKTEQDELLSGAAEWILNSKRVKRFTDAAAKQEATAPGKMFSDFMVTASDGSVKKLSDYVGKGNHVLVDFWASWCGPCRNEMPGLKKIYEKYKGKGLQVLGVAVWDKPEDTRVAVEELQLPWDIIDNAQSEPTELYGIMGIPHIIMFAPDGTILFRGLQGAALAKEVDLVMATAK